MFVDRKTLASVAGLIFLLLTVFFTSGLINQSEPEYFEDYNYTVVEQTGSNFILYDKKIYSCKIVLHNRIEWAETKSAEKCKKFYYNNFS